MTIITSSGVRLDTLCDFSPNDYRFEKWKKLNSKFSYRFAMASQLFADKCDLLPDYFLSDTEKLKLSNISLKNSKSLSSCSPFLSFALSGDSDKFNLKDASFCRSRFCPLCNWRRRLKLGYRFYTYLSNIYQDYNVIFFTATLPNCPIWRLRSSCDILVKAYNTLFGVGADIDSKKRNQGLFSYKYHKGSFRNIEVTRRFTSLDPSSTYEYNGVDKYYYSNKDIPPYLFDYHPHIHAILLFDKSFELPPHNCFNTSNRNNWVSLWASALLKSGLDYPLFYKGLESGDPHFLPSVRVRLIGGQGIRKKDLSSSDDFQKADLKSDIYEVCKYGFDVSKFDENSDSILDEYVPGASEAHLAIFADQLFNYRFLSSYGCLRGINIKDDQDLIRIDDNSVDNQVSSNIYNFNWNNKYSRYIHYS